MLNKPQVNKEGNYNNNEVLYYRKLELVNKLSNMLHIVKKKDVSKIAYLINSIIEDGNEENINSFYEKVASWQVNTKID